MASRSIDELTPEARKACNDFLWEANRRLRKADTGLEVMLTCTYRSQQEQNYLYSLGRTRPGKIVTWAKNSIHTQRRAWDVVFRVVGIKEIRWDGPWRLLGQVAKHFGITWGGNWRNFQDRPHFQVDE